jgi:hypothetical protein
MARAHQLEHRRHPFSWKCWSDLRHATNTFPVVFTLFLFSWTRFHRFLFKKKQDWLSPRASRRSYLETRKTHTHIVCVSLSIANFSAELNK